MSACDRGDGDGERGLSVCGRGDGDGDGSLYACLIDHQACGE